jgi:hypothetical protein
MMTASMEHFIFLSLAADVVILSISNHAGEIS